MDASVGSMFPSLDLEQEPLVEGLWGLMSEEERSGVVSADSPEEEAIAYVPDGLFEGTDEHEDIEEVIEYEFDQGEQPQKRRRVALSPSPKASRSKDAAAKGRRKSIANVVQAISDAMAKAQPSPARPQEDQMYTEELVEDQMKEQTAAESRVADDRLSGETQQREDAAAEAGPDEEEAAASILAREGQPEPRLLLLDGQVPEAWRPADPNDTDIEEGQGRQEQPEPARTSQETRATNGTGSAYAVSEASEIAYVPPQTNLPPRKMAANPTTNIPPAARVVAQPPAKSTTKFATKSAALSAAAPQGVKRKRGRPRKIVEPIVEPIVAEPSVQPHESAQPERAAKRIPWRSKGRLPQTRRAVAQKEHPPPTQITASSLMPAASPAPPRGQMVKAVPAADPEPASDDSDTAQDTGPAEAIQVVEFPTGTVTSIAALMCSPGWTGQSMWKGTVRWRLEDEECHMPAHMPALTKGAERLVWQLLHFERDYHYAPKLGGSDFAPSPSVVQTLRKQTDHFSGELEKRRLTFAQGMEECLSALCRTLLGGLATTADGGGGSSGATKNDAAAARRSRAIVADDVVSYVIPKVVVVLEAACCLGGSKPDKELDEKAFSVPLETVRITKPVWHLINQAMCWLVRLENAVAHELGYRDDHDSTAMGLGLGLGMGMAESEAADPWHALNARLLARNREKSNDRAQLKVLLNRLQDELCYARIRFERAHHASASEQPEQSEQPQQPLIDLTKHTTPAQPVLPALPVAETMEIDNWDRFKPIDIDISDWSPRVSTVATAAAASTVLAHDEAAPAPKAAPRQVAKRPYRLPSLDIDDSIEESMNDADITIDAFSNARGKNSQPLNAPAAADSRGKRIEIVLSPKRPASAVPAAVDYIDLSRESAVPVEADNAVAEESIEVVKDLVNDAVEDDVEDAEFPAQGFVEDAVKRAAKYAAEKAIGADEVQSDAESDVEVEYLTGDKELLASAAAVESDKRAGPDKNPFSRSWIEEAGDDEGEPMMTRAIPRTATASSSAASSDAGSEEQSIFVRPHLAAPEQRVEAVSVASSPAPAPTPEPAPASKSAAARPAEASQDDSLASSPYTRAELKTILSILRTKGTAFNLRQLAAELGRDVLDVANRIESIKAAARTAALREKKPIQPWACAGFQLDN